MLPPGPVHHQERRLRRRGGQPGALLLPPGPPRRLLQQGEVMLLLKNWKLWAAGVLLALASGGLIYGLWQRSEVIRLSTYAQALENRVAGLESSERALRASAEAANRARKAAQSRADLATKELQDAYKANPDWAAGAVPDGVWRALGVEPYPTP